MICGYVALRFEPKFAVPVLIAIFHDILITAGVYSLTGKEVSSGTVAAFLTILGYSIYDTIIVFDRIRENMPRMPRAAFSQIVNRSMSEVLTRSLATSFSTLLAVVSLLIFGGATLQDFAFAMLVGIVSGTYSSIFIASPVLTAWKEREPGFIRRRLRIAEVEGGLVPAFADDVADDEARRRRRSRNRVAASRARGRRGRAGRPAPSPPPSAPATAATSPSPAGNGTTDAADAASAERRERNDRAPRPPPGPPQTRKESLTMALLVWFTMGIALWHFTVFLPDHFWQGIVGAFVGAVLGAMVFGLIVQLIGGKGLGDTDLVTALTRDSRRRDRPRRRLRDRPARRTARRLAAFAAVSACFGP